MPTKENKIIIGEKNKELALNKLCDEKYKKIDCDFVNGNIGYDFLEIGNLLQKIDKTMMLIGVEQFNNFYFKNKLEEKIYGLFKKMKFENINITTKNLYYFLNNELNKLKKGKLTKYFDILIKRLKLITNLKYKQNISLVYFFNLFQMSKRNIVFINFGDVDDERYDFFYNLLKLDLKLILKEIEKGDYESLQSKIYLSKKIG